LQKATAKDSSKIPIAAKSQHATAHPQTQISLSEEMEIIEAHAALKKTTLSTGKTAAGTQKASKNNAITPLENSAETQTKTEDSLAKTLTAREHPNKDNSASTLKATREHQTPRKAASKTEKAGANSTQQTKKSPRHSTTHDHLQDHATLEVYASMVKNLLNRARIIDKNFVFLEASMLRFKDRTSPTPKHAASRTNGKAALIPATPQIPSK